jgi:aldose sugar dehydrogenase
METFGERIESKLASVYKVVDNPDEFNSIIFGKGFSVITDIQISPDYGYMYILNYPGTIYRIVPSQTR